MFASMRKLTTATLLALPGLVSAAPIFVEYDAHIAEDCSWCGGSRYLPGERMSGWLKIDTDLAPPNRFADSPGNQPNAQYWKIGGQDFISGVGWRGTAHLDDDAVQVIDDAGRFSNQNYWLWDYSINPKGATILHLAVSSEDRVDDFIHGNGLAQSFDTETLEGDIRLFARITHVVEGVWSTFDFVLDRLSVTPGQCRAP